MIASEATSFVGDYFALGAERWRERYRERPAGMTAEKFVEVVRASGRELLFVDRPWTSGPPSGVQPYLLHEASQRQYVLFSVDASTAVLEGRFPKLPEALLAKARLLLGEGDERAV